MVYATADGSAGDRLRVGMVGGGRNAFIGAVHRFAMRLDDQIALVAGALSADPENAAASAAETRHRARSAAYADCRAMARAEAARPDGIEAVVIVTPNHLHAPIATAFLEAGIDVICDKPLATTLAEAEALVALAEARRRQLLVTLNNTGYAMVRQAREMVAAGELGTLVSVHASYIQDWLTRPIDAEGQKQAEWRTDPARAGQSAVLADIGVHAFNLACFVSGLRGGGGGGRSLHRRAGATARRQRPCAGALDAAGARGTIVASQTSPGHYNDLSVRVYGDKGGLEWSAARPEELRFTRYGEEARTLIRGGHGSAPRRPGCRGCRRRIRRATSRPSPTSTATPAAIIRAHRRGERRRSRRWRRWCRTFATGAAGCGSSRPRSARTGRAGRGRAPGARASRSPSRMTDARGTGGIPAASHACDRGQPFVIAAYVGSR